jgi:hypothetical protein
MTSLTPKTWGPVTWIMLHLLTLSYPDNPTMEDIENHKQFLISLSRVLPCKECRDHFKEHLQKCALSHALKSRETYVKCMWNMHNGVDKTKQISYDEFIKIYKDILEKDGYNPIKISNCLKMYKYLTYGLITIIIIMMYKIYKRK